MIKEIIITITITTIIIALFYQFWFLRNPERNIPKGNNIVSPADGTIVKIIEINENNITIEKGLVGKIKTMTNDTIKEGYLINIMMTPLDVHYQRSPVDGTILSVKHKDGFFRNAVLGTEKMQAIENERTETIINSSFGKIKVIQIAGFLARRIVTDVKPKQNIKKGEHLGLIKLGSQVSLIIPKHKLKVKEGDYVYAGETIIAK